jgi:hypothetical protein
MPFASENRSTTIGTAKSVITLSFVCCLMCGSLPTFAPQLAWFNLMFVRTTNAACCMLLFRLSTPSAEPCHFTGPRYNLASDTVEWSMAIESGHSCIGGLRIANVVFGSLKLVSKPQYGKIELHGPGLTYSTKADGGEKDSFTLALAGEINRRAGTSTIHVTVTIEARLGSLDSPAFPTTQPSSLQFAPSDTIREAAGAPLPSCPKWDWSKGAPPPMRSPFDRSKLYCPPSPFNPPSPPIGCICGDR